MPDERMLQEQFYAQLCAIDGTIAEIDNYTDGVIRGTIIENKLKIDNPAVPLCQAISYLSKFRNLAKDVPGRIMTIDFTRKYVRIYNSDDFLEYIERPHLSAASKSKVFITDVKPIKEYCYDKNLIEVVEDLRYSEFVRVHIDFYNIVANAQRFYMECPSAQTKKLAFRKELLNPQILNIYPIPVDELKDKEKTEFAGVIDCLNDKILQKELGAFYTPDPYVKLSTQMVREAISKIKKSHPDNDYIIIDRCAGTGNLENFFTDCAVSQIHLDDLNKYIPEELFNRYIQDKKLVFKMIDKPINQITLGELEDAGKTNMCIFDYMFDNELSHCVLSTYETWEWTILNAKYADKVRLIIPPEGTINKYEPLVMGADALSEAFITGNEGLNIFGNLETNDAYLRSIRQLNKYVDSDTCNVILYENPPYRDTSSVDKNENTKSNKNIFAFEEMKKELNLLPNSNISTARDVSNLFIWSGYKYYLKKDNDFLVLYSPIKYWKSLGLSDRRFIRGYLFNRAFFHASPSAISCILWQNIADDRDTIELLAVDIQGQGLKDLNYITMKKVYSSFEGLFDRRKFDSDQISNIRLDNAGYETFGKKCDGNSYYNDNIIGYLAVKGLYIAPINYTLVRHTFYNLRGFYLRRDNFDKKLPLFCAKLYPQENWFERDVYFTTADKGSTYEADLDFLKKCLLYTCLTNRNHCISFVGSDGRFYKNELCLCQNTAADEKLQFFILDETDNKLIKEWQDVLNEVTKTDEYKQMMVRMPDCTLGLHQIEQEIDVFLYNGGVYNKKQKMDLVKGMTDKEKKMICHKYPELVKEIDELKALLKVYYKEEIEPRLFEYELLK